MAIRAGRKKAWWAVVLGIAFCLTNCALKVAPGDLTGQWQMSDAGVKLLGLKVRPAFTLHPGGSLTAANLPASAFVDPRSWRRLYSGDGTWTVPVVGRTEGFALIVLDFKKSGPDEPTGLTLQVDKDSTGLYIFAWLDEEGGDRLTFRRE